MAANSLTMRSETDLLGSMQISNNAYYGIQTQRAMDNFQLSGKKLKQHPELIQALAQVKAACAQANNKQKLLDNDKTNAICSAAVKVVNGDYDDQFLIDMIQGGAGTSSNMNINEVLANVGLELMGHEKGQYALLHPNTDVNMSQSTNDVYPTAVRLSILLKQQK